MSEEAEQISENNNKPLAWCWTCRKEIYIRPNYNEFLLIKEPRALPLWHAHEIRKHEAAGHQIDRPKGLCRNVESLATSTPPSAAGAEKGKP